jgi:peroxiredoxin
VTLARDAPREGQLLPSFALPRSGGGTVRVRAYRNRRSLALIFAHGVHCDGCRDYLAGALDRYADYAAEDAEVIAVVPGQPEMVDAMRRALALPFPIAADPDGAVLRRYGLTPGAEAAAMATDRFGAPRIWQVARGDHALPAHDELIAELRYLALTCSAGCAVPVWPEA